MTRRLQVAASPTRVVLGAGAAALVGEELSQLGSARALVLSTNGRRSEADRIAAEIGERGAGVLAIAEEHVPMDVAVRGRAEAARVAADALVAVGGGSTVGLAKAIALVHTVPIVAIPTTYSGSEMTPVFGLTDGGVKRTGRDERVRAACVLYDPLLSRDLPARVAVPSAFNALAHAVEALYAPECDEAMRELAEDSVRLLAGVLPALAAGSRELDVRERALHGACLAGACLGRASMGLHHKLAHVLGGTFGLPHAETHAALLPHTARYNLAAAPAARVALARALGGEPVDALVALVDATGVKRGLGALGLKRESLDHVAELATAAPYPNPRPVTKDALVALLEAAL